MRRRAGFTLVELLVVIGIIALLVSLLIPSLTTAKDLAKAARCASNLRSMYTSFMNYADDFKGIWPAPWRRYPDVPREHRYRWQWPYIISHYVVPDYPLDEGDPTHPRSDFSKDMRLHNAPQAFCLVVHEEMNVWWYSRGPNPNKDRAMTSWSYAMLGGGIDDYIPTYRLKGTGSKVLLSDFHVAPSEGWANVWSRYDGIPLDPHLEASNYLFADGHVQRLDALDRDPAMWRGFD